MKKFFRVDADSRVWNRWYLKSPVDLSGVDIDPRRFTKCEPYLQSVGLTFPVRSTGNRMEFNFCDFDMPVVTSRIFMAISEIAGNRIQWIQVKIEGVKNDYGILNVLDSVACLDERKSGFERWGEDSARPDKIGKIRSITHLRIDPNKVGEHHIFRLSDWMIAMVVSSEVKELLEKMGVAGISFEPLT
ncbi:imm11 family protein [Pseudoduganella sp. R-32]|uniref:imm11 family protein n=1 Tax=Pseudoduganella sp. R-32 TaxID=3404061 RepID=UPI003CF5F7DC